MLQLGNIRTTKHLYQLTVRHLSGVQVQIQVFANTRAQASRIAEREGYEVCDVNMIG